MPTPEDGGRTYTFRLKAGIYFADDPAFVGSIPRGYVPAATAGDEDR